MATHETDTRIDPSLDAYAFADRDWQSFDEVREAFEWAVPDQFNMATYVCDRWAATGPDREAIIVAGHEEPHATVTYGQLRRDANRLANALASQGVERGDRVAVHGARMAELVLGHLAAWTLGAVSVPVSVRFGPEALRYRLADCEATAFVALGAGVDALRESAPELDTLTTVLTVGERPAGPTEDAFWDVVSYQSPEFETATTDPEETATLVYTSGTTGPPKGAVHPHRTLLGMLPSHVLTAWNMELRPDDLLYSPAEWSWLGPLYQGVLPTLYYGGTVLGDADPQFDPERTFQLFDRYGVTIVGGATTVYRLMMEVPDPAGRFGLSNLRVILGAGEPLGQTVVEWWRETVPDVAVHEAYGQTEAGVFVGDCEALGVAHKPGRMGRVMPGYELGILDIDTGEPVTDGERGELVLRYEGALGCFGGFWNAPGKTDDRIQNGWLLTGDVGSIGADGYVSFYSRTDDVITSAGYRIGPAEIEESLAEHEAVTNAGVIGVPDDTRGEILKAFVMLAPEVTPSDDRAATLQDHVKSRVAKHEYPRELEFVDELPLTTTGKVRRHDLRNQKGLVD